MLQNLVTSYLETRGKRRKCSPFALRLVFDRTASELVSIWRLASFRVATTDAGVSASLHGLMLGASRMKSSALPRLSSGIQKAAAETFVVVLRVWCWVDLCLDTFLGHCKDYSNPRLSIACPESQCPGIWFVHLFFYSNLT